MTEKAVPEIRIATSDDVTVLAEVARRTFYDAFKFNVNPADMDRYLRESFSHAQIAAELVDPASLFLLATLDGAAVGYAKLHFGLAHESVQTPIPVKLWRIYADNSRIGTGIGAALMRASIAHAHERGGRSLWLTTNIHNERAIAFYRRWGFEVVGATTFRLGDEIHEDHVMALVLADGPSNGSPTASPSSRPVLAPDHRTPGC